MIVRPLRAEDGAAWHALLLDATQTHPAAFLLSHREVAGMTPEHIANDAGRGHLRGLFDGDRLVGFAGLHLWKLDRLRHRADIGPFYVAPEARGTGAADILMQALEDAARAEGVVWLDLWVAEENGRAQAFYRRRGFETVARRADAVRLDGMAVDDVMMARRLATH